MLITRSDWHSNLSYMRDSIFIELSQTCQDKKEKPELVTVLPLLWNVINNKAVLPSFL